MGGMCSERSHDAGSEYVVPKEQIVPPAETEKEVPPLLSRVMTAAL